MGELGRTLGIFWALHSGHVGRAAGGVLLLVHKKDFAGFHLKATVLIPGRLLQLTCSSPSGAVVFFAVRVWASEFDTVDGQLGVLACLAASAIETIAAGPMGQGHRTCYGQ